MGIETINTYLNRKGYPMLRRCFNCKFWTGDIILEDANEPLGYCKNKPLFFAFNLEQSVYPIMKNFYMCEDHKFENEEKLKECSQSVNLKDSLKKKKEI